MSLWCIVQQGVGGVEGSGMGLQACGVMMGCLHGHAMSGGGGNWHDRQLDHCVKLLLSIL